MARLCNLLALVAGPVLFWCDGAAVACGSIGTTLLWCAGTARACGLDQRGLHHPGAGFRPVLFRGVGIAEACMQKRW